MNYTINTLSNCGKCEYVNETVHFVASTASADARFFLEVNFEDWEDDCYVLVPACAYDGNKYGSVERPYPPMYHKGEVGENEEPLILRGIPSLGKDGKGKLECTVADASSPIIGIFNHEKKEAFFLFTEQRVKDKNIGYSIINGKITVQFPADREYAYRFHLKPDYRPDKGISMEAGEKVSSKVLIRCFSCQDIPGFYEIFFSIRKLLMSSPRPKNGYTPELLKIMIEHFNNHNYSGKYYGNTLWITWQPGWCGGGMSSYPLYMLGTDVEKQRAIDTLDYLTENTSKIGLPYIVYNFDQQRDDSKSKAIRSNDLNPNYVHLKGAHLTRRDGDVLIFLIKQFRSGMPVKEKWVETARKIADVSVDVFKKNGTFGQYVNIETGEIMVKMSCSGAPLIGGLAMASDYFKSKEYLDIALAAGEFYYQEYLSKGISNGGPGDALTAHDSESCYAFVESYVLLYEATGDKKWLEYAKTATHLLSSWVMTYNFKFPENTEFDILGIETVGSVFANIQNKHSAPGLCTFSGDAIYRLYKYTGNKEYLELIKDIAYFMPQCVSTDEHPIYDWDHKHGDPEGRLPNGYICERVNTSDWEYDRCVGGVFNVSCWCETSILLTFLELMDKPEMN